jgi:hypothetical protein
MTNEITLSRGGLLPQNAQDEAGETTQEKTPGGERETRWEVVAVARGLAQAAIISGRLETEGIPTQVQQEPAGVAIGLIMGRLGEARVLVPAPLAERARGILSQTHQELADDVEK